MRKLKAYLALDRRDRALFWTTWLSLCGAKMTLRMLGLQRTQKLLARRGGTAASPDDAEVRKLVKWVDVAAGNIPGGAKCLPRSIALLALLRRRGIACELRIGVRAADPGIAAHAWIEIEGQPVNDDLDVAQRFRDFGSAIPSL